MLKKILLGLAVVLVLFLGYVSTRSGEFRFERSGLIEATAAEIFPYISDLHQGSLWDPYEQKDLNMKKTITGPGNQVGSTMEFDGNQEVGSGKIEILKIVPNERVELKLTMLKPFQSENLIVYQLTPESSGTRFSWAMSGDGGFMGKLMGVFIDCEKMMSGDFETGVKNLKTLVESRK